MTVEPVDVVDRASSLPHVLFVCTGNAARSVMATAMTRARTNAVTCSGAGTHSIEGLPMSSRTRGALANFGVSDPDHRSHQLVEADLEQADLVVTFEPMHLRFIRTMAPDAAGRTASLKRLARDLGSGAAPLSDRLAALELASVEHEPWEEVIDPAGGELDAFIASATEIDGLLTDLLPRIG